MTFLESYSQACRPSGTRTLQAICRRNRSAIDSCRPGSGVKTPETVVLAGALIVSFPISSAMICSCPVPDAAGRFRLGNSDDLQNHLFILRAIEVMYTGRMII